MHFVKNICLLFLLIPQFVIEAQDLKRVIRTLEKGDITKAKELLEIQISKDSINPGSRWMYARLLSCDSLPQYYDLDQARTYGQQAVSDFQQANEKIKLAFIETPFSLLDIQKRILTSKIKHMKKSYHNIQWMTFVLFFLYIPKVFIKKIFSSGLIA